MSRSLKTVAEMTEELTATKNRDGYTKRLYKQESDKHKGVQLQADIQNRISALGNTKRADLNNLEQVKERTFSYLEACAAAEVYPSVMGLAVHGFGMSRQALDKYLRANENSTTEFIEMTKDTMADILTNASLFNNANAVQAIFQLKNHFRHADKVEIEAVAPANALGEAVDIKTIEARYNELPDE